MALEGPATHSTHPMGHVQLCDGTGKAGSGRRGLLPLEETSSHFSLSKHPTHTLNSLFQTILCFLALTTFACCSILSTDFFRLFGLWNISSMRAWTVCLAHDYIPITALDITDFMYSHWTVYPFRLPIKCKLQEDGAFFCLAEKPRAETET